MAETDPQSYGSLDGYLTLNRGHRAVDPAARPRSCCERTAVFWRKWKPALIVALINILTGVSNVVLVPILPGIKRRYLGSDQEAANLSTILQAVGAVIALAVAPIAGVLMDSFGRRPFFVVGLTVNILPPLLLLFDIQNPLPYMIGFTAMSFFTGAYINTYLADCYSPKLRVQVFAITNAAATFTAISSLLIFGLSDYTLVLLSVILQATAAAVAFLFIRESLSPDCLRPFSCASIENPFKAMKSVLTSKIMIACITMIGIFSISETGVGEVYMYYLNQRVGFHKDDNATVYLEMGVLNPFVFLALIPLLTRVFKLRQVTLILISLVALAGEMVVLCLLYEKWQIYALGLPMDCLVNMSYPAISAIIANGATAENQGRRQVGFTAIIDLFGAIAPIVFGQTYSHLHGNLIILPFVLAGVACVPGFLLALKLRQWVIKGEDNIVDDDAEAPSSDSSVDTEKSDPLLSGAEAATV